MYIPDHYRESRTPELHSFMERNAFALLVSYDGTAPFATHLPLLLDASSAPLGTLVGHMARANSQWRHAAGCQVLVVFSGPHAYVSPRAMGPGDFVPTWNYVAVHAYGRLRTVSDGRLREILDSSASRFEATAGGGALWTVKAADPNYIGARLKAIVGFEIEIERLEGKWKLSQNHPEGVRRRIAQALGGGPTDGERAIARLITEGPGTGE